jgi:hypothetical protein
MERIGFFSTDTAEPCQALVEQVWGKRGNEGLEISPAPGNPGAGPGMRRASASMRIDLPAKRKGGPVIALLAPRGVDPGPTASKLTAAGVMAPEVEVTSESVECTFLPDTEPSALIDFSIASLRAIGGLGIAVDRPMEWMWAVRGKGLVPR